MRPRIGLSVMTLETRREAIIGLATEGDRLGYDGFFLPETWAYDMTVLLGAARYRGSEAASSPCTLPDSRTSAAVMGT
jgi:alkanesulfonate monooxygenase SsuD/methylene tetrahydromethanopterin reductase-like flavin-dependent oxidoreductase (luciferase family)